MGLNIEIVAGARSFKIFCGQPELESPSRFSLRTAPRRSRLCTSCALGLRTALDDLVTGYPFDKLKIDQPFVRDVTGS
jgi:hypothetical protein